MDSLVEAAVRNNLDLKKAAAAVDNYLGILETTRSQYFPADQRNDQPPTAACGRFHPSPVMRPQHGLHLLRTLSYGQRAIREKVSVNDTVS